MPGPWGWWGDPPEPPAAPWGWWHWWSCPAAVQFLTKYVESGFEAVWFASAFKGTTGPAQAWTPLSYHLKNHLSWLKVMQAVPRLAPLRLQGVVLTGWQR